MKTLLVLLLTSVCAMAQVWHVPLKPAKVAYDKLAKDNVSVRADVTKTDGSGVRTIRIQIRGNTHGELKIEAATIYPNAYKKPMVNMDASTTFSGTEGEVILHTLPHEGVKGWLVRVLRDGRVVGVAASSPVLATAAESIDPVKVILGK